MWRAILFLLLVAACSQAARAQQAVLGSPEILHDSGAPIITPGGQPIELSYGDRQLCAGDFPDNYSPPWTWQVVPSGLIYRSYLAGPRESRLGTAYNWATSGGARVWDFTLGGHVGLLRYGTGEGPRPGGFQLDVEGAAFPRLNSRSGLDLMAVDFRGGFPLTFAYGPWELKGGYYHTSSHLGDEFLLANPGFPRRNYVRDEVIVGLAYRIRPAIRLYGEAGYAFKRDGGAEPWQVQFGAEYSDLAPTGFRGSPFLAANGHLRQEVNWGGSLSAQAGWQWRGYGPGHLLRIGVNYFNGITEEYSFFDQYEQFVGIGAWYDY